MANKKQCEWYDYVGDKPSKLHKELIKKQTSRPEGNLIYAMYKTSDIADKMDAAGYKRNSQGQHEASDVLKFLEWNRENSTISQASEDAGAVDDKNNVINYTDSTEALQKANDFNDSRNNFVANVYKHGDTYNIVVSQKNSRTFNQVDEVKEKLKVWEYYNQAFGASGVDMTSIPEGLKSRFSAYNDTLIEYLQGLKRSDFKYMTKEDALTIFFMNADSPLVQRLVGSFGSLDAAAQAVTDVNKGTANLEVGQLRLLDRAISSGKEFPNLNLDNIQKEVAELKKVHKSSSPSEAISNELHRLNKKYHIDFNETHRTSSRINTLSDAATEAVLNLERQIRQIEREEGKNEEGKRLSWIKEQLLKELANKRYYSGILNFLQEASRQLNFDPETGTSVIDDILREAGEKTGTDLEKAMAMAKALQQIQDLSTMFYPLVSALSNENMSIDESIGQQDIENIRNTAKRLKDVFDKQDRKVYDKVFDTMENIMVEIVGDETPEGISIHNALRMAAQDSSMWDYLYSVGRVSNPVIAAMGGIVRKAQNERDAIMNDWALRTRRATDKLYKSGSNSEFMYEDEGHIASPYDWVAYSKAKAEQAKLLRKQKLDEWAFRQALENWDQENTVEVVVDEKSGRTERVPNEQYRKERDFQEGWTEAQKEYYKEMMQIKGEIGTLLPAYAQMQFRPPQVRREMLDALGNAKSAKDVSRALWNKIKNIWTIREDDPDFAKNGIVINGQERLSVESDFDNTKLRNIPIFFINRVESGELLKDFSGAIQHLAGTAANYSTMNDIADVVEFIGDFAKNQAVRGKNAEADIVGNKFFKVVSDVVKEGKNSNTENLVNNFIAQHIYGQKLDPEQAGYNHAKKILSLIGYTSFKGLVTNVTGAVSNYLVGELQMLIEASGGEFYGFWNLIKANDRLFGGIGAAIFNGEKAFQGAGIGGEISELLTNNMNHRATLFREKYDPINDNFSDKSGQRYYKSMFRQLVGHDCAFIGYASGEYLIHYVNMYAVLDNVKVLHNGKKISLFDAYEVVSKEDGNSELKLKDGVTTLDGQEITPEFEDKIRNRIRYCNQTCHGSMNAEDKGIINQKLWGRAINNFRQWMWEHLSRRFRERHFDYTLGEMREGYWRTFYNQMFKSEKTKEAYETEDVKAFKAVGMFIQDFVTFSFRAQAQWSNLSEAQKHNVRRVMGEMSMYLCLLGLSFALGEPEDHKKEWWRRWWMYQTKRLILEVESAMPNPHMISSGLTILQSPVPAVNTANSLLYTIYGLTNGDITSKLKSGPHKGENKYWRNFKKYNLPFFKDYERLQTLGDDETIFQVFKDTPSNR